MVSCLRCRVFVTLYRLMAQLGARKQEAKLSIYRSFTYVLIASLVLAIVFAFYQMCSRQVVPSPDLAPSLQILPVVGPGAELVGAAVADRRRLRADPVHSHPACHHVPLATLAQQPRVRLACFDRVTCF